jgi:hypothetical protein
MLTPQADAHFVKNDGIDKIQFAFQPILKKARDESFRTTDIKQWCPTAIAFEFPPNKHFFSEALIAAAI